MPLHPLVVHAVVVLGPLAALTGLVYAAVPRWRWLLRWPLVVLAVSTAVASVVAVQAGGALLDLRPELEPLVEEHQEYGELLRTVALAYAVVSAVAAWALGGASALASGRGARETRFGIPVAVVLAVVAVGLLVVLYLAGDSGARAVWG